MPDTYQLDEHFFNKEFQLPVSLTSAPFRIAVLLIYCAPVYLVYSLITADDNPSKKYTFSAFEITFLMLFLFLPFIIVVPTYLIKSRIKYIQQNTSARLSGKKGILFFAVHLLYPLLIFTNMVTLYITYIWGDLTLNSLDDLTYYLYLLIYDLALLYFYLKIREYLSVFSRIKKYT